MKFIKKVFNDIVGKIKKVYEIAPVTIVSLLVLTIITVICFDNFNKVTDYVVAFLIFLTVGAFLTESLNKEKVIGYSVSALVALIFTVLVNAEDGPTFWTMMFALCYMLCAAILGVYFRYKASKKSLENYVTGAFVSICKLSVIYGVISIGVLIIYALVNFLLFEDADVYDIIERIELFILGAYYGPSIIYSIFIPESETEGFFKVLIKYVMNIIVLVYFVVIYLYIIKILFALDLPSNEIFNIVSVLFACGLPVWTMAASYNAKKLSFLDKANNIMPYLFAPFIGLQTYAMMIRVFSYGLTPSRYLGLMLIAVEVAYIVLYAFKKTDKTFFVAVIAVAVSTVVPFINANTLSNYSQSLVIKNFEMTRTYTKDETSRIKSAYSYLRYSEGGQKYIDKYLTKEEINRINEYEYSHEYERDYEYVSASLRGYDRPINVEGYSEVYPISVNGYEERGLSIQDCFQGVRLLDNDTQRYDIYPLISDYLLHQDKIYNYFEENNEYIIDENTKLVLTSFDLSYYTSNNDIKDYYLNGYVLKR